MTREEALEGLEGTWSFELIGDQVLIRELSLLSAVNGVRRERAAPVGWEPRQVATVSLQGAAASGD